MENAIRIFIYITNFLFRRLFAHFWVQCREDGVRTHWDTSPSFSLCQSRDWSLGGMTHDHLMAKNTRSPHLRQMSKRVLFCRLMTRSALRAPHISEIGEQVCSALPGLEERWWMPGTSESLENGRRGTSLWLATPTPWWPDIGSRPLQYSLPINSIIIGHGTNGYQV